jgi:hypothetical protein
MRSSLAVISTLAIVIVIGMRSVSGGGAQRAEDKPLEVNDAATEPVISTPPPSVESASSQRVVRASSVSRPQASDDELGSDPAVVPPTRSEYAEGVAENPHGVPETLLQFADRVAQLLEYSRESEQAAAQLLEVLESCITDDDRTLPVRAYCGENLLNLSKTRGGPFKEAWERIEAELDPKVRRLITM